MGQKGKDKKRALVGGEQKEGRTASKTEHESGSVRSDRKKRASESDQKEQNVPWHFGHEARVSLQERGKSGCCTL